MANHKSSEKRARQTKVRTERNRFYKTRIKNLTKNVLTAVSANDAEAADTAFKAANKNIHSYVSKGILAKNTAARKVGRLAKLVSSLKTKAA
ncbi:MAG: 30S ribosomal protein S20 [Campylobacteraceae bacterium]|jgi:small subunit ribosomal protein S20|nr:30S ribosomal protein S20 [Campylobacteraceae bacterium]